MKKSILVLFLGAFSLVLLSCNPGNQSSSTSSTVQGVTTTVGASNELPSESWTAIFGTDSPDNAQAVDIAADGSIFVAGTSYSGIDGETSSDTLSNEIFVSKYTSSGTRLWTKLFGSSAADKARGIKVASDGSVYVCGVTWGDFGGQTNNGGQDGLLMKLDSNGNLIWARLIGTPGGSWGEGLQDVTEGSDGNLYVVGSTDGNLTNSGGPTYAAFAAQYSSSGDLGWVKIYGGGSFSDTGYAYSIEADGAGNLYAAGALGGDYAGYTNAGSGDLYVMKLNESGSETWFTMMGGDRNDQAWDVAVDSSGNVYASGHAVSAVVEGVSNTSLSATADIILTKLNASGEIQWVKLMGTAQGESACGIEVGPGDNLYAAGYWWPGGDLMNLYEVVVLLMDGNGNVLDQDVFETTEREEGLDLAVFADGSVAVCGETGGDLNGTTAPGSGSYDGFLMMLKD